MSQEVAFTILDYNTITNWYSMAFGKKENATRQDQRTIRKLSVMADALQEEEALLKKLRGDKDE